MAKLISVAIRIVVLAAVLLQSIEAAEYVVGDSKGWIVPTGGASVYTSWASNHTFKIEDTLMFNFTTGRHDVGTISKRDFDDCNDDNTMDLITTSPAKFTINRTGEYYFTCTFPTHCSKGQKLSIKVSGSSPAPTEAPSSPPEGSVPSSPSGSEPLLPSSTIAPPPEGSAMSVDATFSAIIMTTAMNLLFQF